MEKLKYRFLSILLTFLMLSVITEGATIHGATITCTSKDEPILVSGAVNKAFTMKINEKVQNCNGYCISKLVSLDATLANGDPVHIRNVHFSCVPVVPKAEAMCTKTCTTKIYKNDTTSKSIDRSVGSLKRVLVKEIGDFSYEKAEEKTCCCKDAKCSRRLDATMRLNLRSNFKIH